VLLRGAARLRQMPGWLELELADLPFGEGARRRPVGEGPRLLVLDARKLALVVGSKVILLSWDVAAVADLDPTHGGPELLRSVVLVRLETLPNLFECRRSGERHPLARDSVIVDSLGNPTPSGFAVGVHGSRPVAGIAGESSADCRLVRDVWGVEHARSSGCTRFPGGKVLVRVVGETPCRRGASHPGLELGKLPQKQRYTNLRMHLKTSRGRYALRCAPAVALAADPIDD
jgi:hypothetical protein